MVKPKARVNFAVGTIDNENMGKKKSKCKFLIQFNLKSECFFYFLVCCIFNGGHKLESSSSSGEEDHDTHDCAGKHHGGRNANRYDRYPKH